MTGLPRSQFRRLAVLIGVNFVDMIGFMIVLPLLPFYALKLNATPEVDRPADRRVLHRPAGGGAALGPGIRPLRPPAGAADRPDRVSPGLRGVRLADSLWLLFLSRLVQGAGGGTTGVAQAYVADTMAPGERARALGWLSAATSAGVMFGPAIGSFAAHFGRAAPGLIAATLCLINVIFAWRWLPESRERVGRHGHRRRKPVWHPAWMAISAPGAPIGRLLWIYGVGMIAFSSMTSMMALYLGAEFGLDETTIGYVFLYMGVLSFVMRSVLLGPIVDRIGEIWAMRLGTGLLVVGLALYPLPRDLWTLHSSYRWSRSGRPCCFRRRRPSCRENRIRGSWGPRWASRRLSRGWPGSPRR